MTNPNFSTETYGGIRAVVLGATGFIGRWVARALTAQGATLYLVVRQASMARELFRQYQIEGEIIELDLPSPKGLRTVLSTVNPAITFNLIGYGVDPAERDEALADLINAELVNDLCEAVLAASVPWHGQQLVHVGSALEYGLCTGDLAESSMPHPTTTYGKTKLAGTNYVTWHALEQGLRGITVRLFTVYGPGEHPGRLLPSLLNAAERGQSIALTEGRQRRDFTYVEDVADGLLRLGISQADRGEVINLATGQLTSVRSFVEKAALILGLEETALEFGRWPVRAEEMSHEPVNITRLEQLTGWKPPASIERGICRAIWFLSQPGTQSTRAARAGH